MGSDGMKAIMVGIIQRLIMQEGQIGHTVPLYYLLIVAWSISFMSA